MAVTVTTILRESGLWHVDVISTAVDGPIVLRHGFGAEPEHIVFIPLGANFYTEQWFLVSVDGIVSITINKAGLGHVAASVRLILSRLQKPGPSYG